MREWRNWQTRTFEGRVERSIRVQVPFLAPAKKRLLSTDKRRFFERCVPLSRNVMFASQVMCTSCVMCAFGALKAEHITSLCGTSAIHHCLQSKLHHLRRRRKHHFTILISFGIINKKEAILCLNQNCVISL